MKIYAPDIMLGAYFFMPKNRNTEYIAGKIIGSIRTILERVIRGLDGMV